MKGVSQLISHSTTLVIGITALGMLVIGITSFLFDMETDLTELEMNYLANNVKFSVMRIYSMANTSSQFVNGTFEIPILEKIGNKQILAEFDEANLILSTNVDNQEIKVTRKINLDANLTGRVYFPAKFILEKQNGEISIRMIE